MNVDQPGRLTWRQLAACRDYPVTWWFPDTPLTSEGAANIKRAKDLCDGCAVSFDCLCDAVDGREQFGIWGGMGLAMRTRHRRRADAGPGPTGWRIGAPTVGPATFGTAA